MRPLLLATLRFASLAQLTLSDEDAEENQRSPLEPRCPEEEVWTGWCHASGAWSLSASAWGFQPLGCFSTGEADAVGRARVAGMRMSGAIGPLQCLRACVSSDDHARSSAPEGPAHMFGVGERDRSCYCIRGVRSPAAAGMRAVPANECKAPSCRTDAVNPDALAECPALLRGGLSCGEDFCSDGNRCELAGLCTRSCGMPERDATTCSDTQSHDRLQLYSIEPAAVPTATLPQVAGANPCATVGNVTTCPVALRRRVGNALTACCACGGGNLNAFGGCSDHKGFVDRRGHTCADFAELDLCSDDGFGSVGPGWLAEWGSFKPDSTGRVAHSYAEASVEAVISTGSRPDTVVFNILEDEEPLTVLSSHVSIVQRSLDTWKGAVTSLEFQHRDDPSRLGITLVPLGGTHVEIQGGSVMAPCGFHTVRALTTTKACRSCDAWWDTRSERPGAAVAQGGRGAKWYFEIVVGSDGIAQVGFATQGFTPGEGQGVGDDPYGWAYDGNRQTKWHDPTPDEDDGTLDEGQTVSALDGAEDYGEEWSEGDVVGCLLDLSNPDGGEISFTLTTPGEKTRELGVAFVLEEHQRQFEFYPAATFVDGIWTFRFAPEELQYAPPGVEHFTPPTRLAKLPHRSGSLAALPATVSTDGCQHMLVQAADPDVDMFYSFVLTRPTPAPKVVQGGSETTRPQICAPLIETQCDSSLLAADTMVMWVILGSAATIGFLTMFTMVQGERIRRRRQFQLISGATLQLDNESVQRVLIDDAARTNFRQKFERLQRMLYGFGRDGLIDITVTRETILRDIIELFDSRPEVLEPRNLRSQGLRIRFVDELGIDEGGLRREFYQVLFSAFVSPCALKLALPKPEVAVPSEDAVAAADTQILLTLFEELPSYAYGINKVAAAAVHQFGSDAVAAMVRQATSAGDASPRIAAGFAPDPQNRSTRGLTDPRDGMGSGIVEMNPAASRRGNGGLDGTRLSTEAYLLQEAERDEFGHFADGRRHGLVQSTSTSSFELEPEPEPELESGSVQIYNRAGGGGTASPRIPTDAPPRPGRMARLEALRRPRMARLRRLTSLPAVREALRREPAGAPGSGSHSNEFVSALMNAEPLALYRMCGMFLAKAIIDDVRLNVIFSRALYCQLLSQPVGLDELKDVDEELHSSLNWLLDTDLNDEEQVEGGAEALGLYFDATLPPLNFSHPTLGFGEAPAPAQAIELKPGGAQILVTEENKQEFVELRSAFAHTGLMESQIESLREGFFCLLPGFAQLGFDGAELELLLHGVPDINVGDWKYHTVYRNGYDEDHPTIVAFWAIVENMDQEMQGKLLHFTTGCSRVPLEGFAALRGDGRVCRFTVACTNQPLDELPVRDPSVCVRALVCDSIASH